MFLLRLSKGEEDKVCSWCFPVSHGSLFLSEQSLLLALTCLCDTLVRSEFSPGWARRMWWQRFLSLWSHRSSLLTDWLVSTCPHLKTIAKEVSSTKLFWIARPAVWFPVLRSDLPGPGTAVSVHRVVKGMLAVTKCLHSQGLNSSPRLEQSRHKAKGHRMPVVLYKSVSPGIPGLGH